MSKTYFKLSDADFFQDWSNTGLIGTNHDWSNVASIMGYRGDGMSSPAGRDPRLVTGDSGVVNVTANLANPNTATSGGVGEFHIADPVVALQGSGTGQAPHLVLYLDASGRENLHFSVDLRDIDGSNDNAVQPVAVQYRIGGSGAWTNLPGGYVADISTGPAQASQVTHLEIDLPAAANNQSQVEIRVLTTDAVGSDEWVGVDNLHVTSQAMAADTTAPLLASSSPADGGKAVAPNADILLNFNERVTLGTGTITISDGAGDVRVIDVQDATQVSVSGQTLTVNPTAPLRTGTQYHVSVEAGAVHDSAGNAFGGSGANPIDFRTIADLTRIYEIQGAGHKSDYEGQLVNTRGVVTAIDTTGTKGFYIQDMQGDGNAATSDAVFVFSSSGSAQVKVGDLVEIQGTVVEYAGSDPNNLPITEITSLQELRVVSSGHTVAPTVIGNGGLLPPTEVIDSDNFAAFNPEHDGIDFYESLEGMLVVARDVQVVDDTYKSATWAVTDGGANATGMNDRGGITHGATDVNPERIMIYSDSGVASGTGGLFQTGDKLGDVTGVLTYYGGNYELIPTSALGVQSSLAIARETTDLDGGAAHLTAGAYNMANLDPTDDPAKFEKLGRDIARNLNSPDILGLEEIQDSNGTGTGVLAPDLTMAMLVDAIVAAGGPRYAWVQIDPAAENANGGEANGNIRNVILYDPTRVTYVDGSVKLLADVTPGNGNSFNNSRKPLTADFMFHGEQVTFVSVHNYSRLGSDAMYGVNQPPVISGDARRADQTLAVRDYVQQLQAANPDANIIVAGDFNGFQFETSLTQLEGAGGLANMVWKLPEADRYSSTFEGNNEQIDHLLVSAHLYASAEFDNVHLNTNLPYAAGASDHDAVLSRVLVNQGPVAAANAFSLAEDVALAVDAAQGVLANDSDINGDALTVELVDGPAHGALQLNADGSFQYLGHANYNGADSFSYVARDAHGGSSGVTQVQLTVAAVNDAPAAQQDAAAVQEDGGILIDVLGNDSDVELDALSVVLADSHSALGASLAIVDGKVRYVADADAFDLMAAGQSLTDSFTYMADDGHGGRSAPVTVTVTVREAGDNQSLQGSNKSDAWSDAAGRDSTYAGGNGEDVLFGQDGADRLEGDNGSDILVGGAGIDTLIGGNGPDTFVIGADSGRDIIADFRPNLDSIRVGYAGAANPAGVSAWLKGAHDGSGFLFADLDTDGNGQADAVAITGGSLGANSIVLADWSVAALVGQRFLGEDHKVLGDWLL